MPLVTKQNITYTVAPYGFIATIPKGVEVIPATNLPEKEKFWVEPWDGMSESEESWFRNYGFLLNENDIEYVEDEAEVE